MLVAVSNSISFWYPNSSVGSWDPLFGVGGFLTTHFNEFLATDANNDNPTYPHSQRTIILWRCLGHLQAIEGLTGRLISPYENLLDLIINHAYTTIHPGVSDS